MVRRMVTATVVTLCLSMAGVAAAADVTFVLNTGERQSGQLVYHRDLNIGLIQNGQERSFPVSEVAAILYNGGDPAENELSQLPISNNPAELDRHMLVLRDGRVIHGKVYHWDSGDVIFDSLAGRATYNASDVARLYLSGPPARRVFAGSNQQQVAGNAGRGRGWGRGRQRGDNSGVAGGMGQPQASIRVEANQPWTDTGLVVQSGERIAFSTSGTIEFGRGMNAGPDGNKDLGPRPGYAVRNMPVGGLIGRVGNSAPFAIGSTATPITMPTGGRLLLGVNDDNFKDNNGGYDVNIYRR